jgi:hypothetical protein
MRIQAEVFKDVLHFGPVTSRDGGNIGHARQLKCSNA